MNFGIVLFIIGVILYILGNIVDAGFLYVIATFVLAFSLIFKQLILVIEYTYSNNGIGYNYYGSKKKLEEMKTNDKKGYDKIYNSIGLVPNLGVGSKDKANSTTQSAISDGILTVDSKEIDTRTINTNTENTLHQLDKIFDKKKIEERQELARLFSKNAFEQLHNWQPTTKDGKMAKSIAHGIIGEVAARMAGKVGLKLI